MGKKFLLIKKFSMSYSKSVFWFKVTFTRRDVIHYNYTATYKDSENPIQRPGHQEFWKEKLM